MIRIENDPEFWIKIASHPEVKSALFGFSLEEFREFLLTSRVTPLADEHGGFLFMDIGGTGLIYEFHTMFTPEGWGREVALAAHEAVNWVFNKGIKLLITYEQVENSRSKPPKSFGFTPHGDFIDSPIGQIRLWSLGIDAWFSSPVYRRLK